MGNYLKKWIENARPRSLMQSMMPAVLATICAIGSEKFNILCGFAAILGVVCAHLALNLADDWFDYRIDMMGDRDKVIRQGFRAMSVKYPYFTDGSETPRSAAAAIEYVKEKPYFEIISLNFHTPFPGTEHLALPMEKRNRIIDLILDYKKKGYPIMNSKSGLKAMKSNKFKKRCWMTNFIYVDGTREPQCAGYKIPGLCDKCGFCMAGEEDAVMRLAPDTILAGFKLRR